MRRKDTCRAAALPHALAGGGHRPSPFSRFPDCTPQLKIDRLPCDNAAQGAAYGGAGAGKRRVLLDSLPQELCKEDRKRAVKILKRTEGLKHRQAAEVFLLIEYVDRQRPNALQLQQKRIMHMSGKVVQR